MTTSAVPRFLDIHVLQTLPYSNVNRDDLGSPKSMIFGGTTRTRVSSQAWKRPTRLAVEEAIGEQAVRTRRLPQQVASELTSDGRGWPQELAELAGAQVIRSAETKLALEKGDRSTASLLFLPAGAVTELADLAQEHRPALEKALGNKTASAKALLPKDAVHKVLSSRNGSIALFGRMLAEIPGAGVDGSVQVAHAFTTHSTSVQADFFTAVDDAEEWATDAGSAHMNTGEFSSGVFYRYATLDLLSLTKSIESTKSTKSTESADSTGSVKDPATARTLADAFVTAFISSLPGAKKTSTAPHTPPDLVHLSVRSDRPLSLAAAFEEPVRAREKGWGTVSRTALSDYSDRVGKLLGTGGVVHSAYAGIDDEKRVGLGQRTASYPALVAEAITAAWPQDGKGA
jgi:CRISPR system Cascade subunit CasC